MSPAARGAADRSGRPRPERAHRERPGPVPANLAFWRPPDRTPGGPGPEVVEVDCTTCVARGPACGDCVVSVLLGDPGAASEARGSASRAPDGPLRFGTEEVAALDALAGSGLVPPLRLVRPHV